MSIATWGVFEVCQSALELQCVVEILQEARRDGGVERNACETLIDKTGIENNVIYISNILAMSGSYVQTCLMMNENKLTVGVNNCPTRC